MKLPWVSSPTLCFTVFVMMMSGAHASDLNTRAIRALMDVGQETLNQPLALTGDGRIALADRKLGVTTYVEVSQNVGSGWLAGVRVEVFLDGLHLPELSAGAVGGLDETELEAQETAISDWANLAGVAILGAFAEAQGDKGILEDWIVYSGFTAFRGEGPTSPPQNTDEVLVPLLQSVEPYLRVRKRSAVTFALGVEGGALDWGEIRIDGVVSDSALRAAESVTFPQGKYFLKKYYVLVPVAN